jgi:hypothetical protein
MEKPWVTDEGNGWSALLGNDLRSIATASRNNGTTRTGWEPVYELLAGQS